MEVEEDTQNDPAQVPRHYIFATIPHLSQQANTTGSPKAALRILKSDSIPIILPQPDKIQLSWSNNDYLQGVSQEKIEKLFDKFGEFFRLDKEADRLHWKPRQALLHVETSPGSWTPIVALIIIKDYIQRYNFTALEMWVARIKSQIVSDWKSLMTQCPTPAVQRDFLIASVVVSEEEENHIYSLRGKRWRRERRRIVGRAAKPSRDTNETRSMITTGKDPETPQLGNNSRGRRWRRLRRAPIQSNPDQRTLVGNLSGPLIKNQAKSLVSLTQRSFTTGWHVGRHDLHPADAADLIQNSLHLALKLVRDPLYFLSTMGDGIKVVSSFILRETLNILTFIPRNPCMHRIKVRTLLNLYATLLLGAVHLRALNALGITIIQLVRYKLCNKMCCSISIC
jgi:hypothetical protein